MESLNNHFPCTSFSGRLLKFRSTEKIRISNPPAFLISSSEFSIGSSGGHPLSGISILLCPEANQTSPNTTLLILIHSLLAQTTMLKDGFSFGVENPICHFPDTSAFPLWIPHGVETETSVFDSAAPQN